MLISHILHWNITGTNHITRNLLRVLLYYKKFNCIIKLCYYLCSSLMRNSEASKQLVERLGFKTRHYDIDFENG